MQAGAPFVAPGGALVPIAAVGIIIWLLSSLAWRELIAGSAIVLVTAAIYAVREFRNRQATLVPMVRREQGSVA